MSLDAHTLAIAASWAATALGAGLVLWSWLGEKDAIRKLRFFDCGVVQLFSAVLLRIVAQDRPMNPWDWAMVFIAPLFIAASLWRLARTACPPKGK